MFYSTIIFTEMILHLILFYDIAFIMNNYFCSDVRISLLRWNKIYCLIIEDPLNEWYIFFLFSL